VSDSLAPKRAFSNVLSGFQESRPYHRIYCTTTVFVFLYLSLQNFHKNFIIFDQKDPGAVFAPGSLIHYKIKGSTR
jgi:hypothetical protein